MEDLLKTLIQKIDNLEVKVDSLVSTKKEYVKKEYVKKEGDGKVMMDKYKKGILVSGDTFPIKNTLSENAGKWNKGLNGWMFTNSHLQEVIDAIKEETNVELIIGEGIDLE